MKKMITAVLVIIFFLILLAIIVYKIFSPTSPTPGSEIGAPVAAKPNVSRTADQTAADFYAWYIAAALKDPTFPSDRQLATLMPPWLTPQFISEWRAISEATDGDPVLLAQTVSPAWTKMTVSVVATTSTDSTVLVSLGSGADLNQVLAHLSLVDGKWLVSSVSFPSP